MSKLGFDKAIANIDTFQRRALKGMMQEAVNEFKDNFRTESASGDAWQPLATDSRGRARRDPPYPILHETGKLESEVDMKNVVVRVSSATLTVDPIDERNRGYAAYHEDFTGTHGNNVQREFMTQPDRLTEKQKEVIIKEFNRIL